MSRTIAYCALICVACILLTVTIVMPDVLNDQNEFLKSFVNHELLALLGVILAITLASGGQIHLSFNQIEEHYKKPGALAAARRGVKTACFWLIALFLMAIVIVVLKPLVPEATSWGRAFLNAAALLIVFWNVLILVEIVQTVFAITPRVDV
ncbi:MAG: hypothetical protein ING16_10075 [Roseomonas sp.]|nr:hypothetical protein [Roseomonas sp.]MCA3283205.1 hypothetical protein [Roseomonas sp.]MCA3298790.1 hypothetical protein [Roseomonas sp.]